MRHTLACMNPPADVAPLTRFRRRLLSWGIVALWTVITTPVLLADDPDCLVWIFGWGLGSDRDVAEITRTLERGAQHGINGAMVSFGLDSLSNKDDAYFRRLESVREICNHLKIELIPAIFSIGYGGGILSHNRTLAEGLPVVDAPFKVHGATAVFVPDDQMHLLNGGFEEYSGEHFKGFSFHDDPGKISFADTEVRHSGRASMRMQDFRVNPYGHGRVSQEVHVRPHRCYRATLWVKTEGLAPIDGFQMLVLAGERNIAPRQFDLSVTGDWRELNLVFNSLNFDQVRLYAGMWGGQAGRFWLDDWAIEEIGPVQVLDRPGTPVTVKSADGATTYAEGKDYEPLRDPNLNPYRVDGAALPLRLPPGTRIRDGEDLCVSWYHAMLIHDSQVTLCMAEPEVYEIMDHEMKLLAERLHPRRVMLNMDEIRMGGTCRACAGRDLGELLGECITKTVEIVRRHSPGAMVYIWSDMLDPNHNAHGDYYLAEGSFAGSWKHVPKDLIISVWGGAPREASLRFFAEQGFSTLVACYYDAEDLSDVAGWMRVARPLPKVRGFMYTPWTKKYDLLPAFGDLLKPQ